MNKIEADRLLDFYACLLTEKQQSICDLYFREDLSLQEIAEMSGVSRSAVHDTIRRCEKELQTYEDKLHMSASYQKRLKLYGQIRARGDDEISRLLDLCIDTEND